MSLSIKHHLTIITLSVLCIFFIYNRVHSASDTDISYHLEIDEENWDSFHIRITIENINQSQLVLIMPLWYPGSYIKYNFSQYVENLQAFDEAGLQLPIVQLNSNAWSITTGMTTFLRIEYDINHTNINFMGKAISKSHAIVHCAMNFMYIEELKHLPIRIKYRVPHGWKLATALPGGELLFEYHAKNYDHLIDNPAYMADFNEYYFNVDGHQLYVIFDGEQNFDINSFLVNLKKIVTYQVGLFNEVPFNQYFFLLNINSEITKCKGLAHRNSSYLQLSQESISTSPDEILNNIACNFFHIWNGKRIFPQVFENIDYLHEKQTKNIWFTEGISRYFADLTLIRTKIWSESEFLQHQAKLIEQLHDLEIRFQKSIEESGFYVCNDENNRMKKLNLIKGQLLGLFLDLLIREKSNNEKSLDDVMLFMNLWFGKYREGFCEHDILRAINAITNQDFSIFFNKYIRGVVELPYQLFLNYAGIKTIIVKDSINDPGTLKLDFSNSEIISIDESGPLSKAGLKKGDILYSINKQTFRDSTTFAMIFNSLSPNSKANISAKRNGIELILYAKIETKEKIKARLLFVPTPTEKQLKIRQSWLAGN